MWCVAVCYSVLQCVAVCCSLLQCVAVHVIYDITRAHTVARGVAAYCSVLQCLAMCCSMVQRGAACDSVEQCAVSFGTYVIVQIV